MHGVLLWAVAPVYLLMKPLKSETDGRPEKLGSQCGGGGETRTRGRRTRHNATKSEKTGDTEQPGDKQNTCTVYIFSFTLKTSFAKTFGPTKTLDVLMWQKTSQTRGIKISSNNHQFLMAQDIFHLLSVFHIYVLARLTYVYWPLVAGTAHKAVHRTAPLLSRSLQFFGEHRTQVNKWNNTASIMSGSKYVLGKNQNKAE